MKDIIGISYILGKDIHYLGQYKRGIWFDNNEIFELPKEQRTGFGFKIDLCFGNTIRPIGQFWNKEFWNNEKLRIIDIPSWKWDEFFGVHLSGKIRRLQAIDPTRLKHGAYNPWYGKKLFVLRLPKWVPSLFISIGMGTLFSFYVGNKAFQVDPFTRDLTWTNEKDIERARNGETGNSYYALCPSFTFRKTRMT